MIKNFALISNSAFGRIEEVIKAQLIGIFEPIEDHEEFKIVRLCDVRKPSSNPVWRLSITS